ncbi:plasmid transfer protein [Streptomyces sp. NPDC020875]|uniref:plasmid transfer protein n=1 Tax=Streptomyces sp. NPDC020875 TaxID=3154898 RepID=UPI0033C1B70F
MSDGYIGLQRALLTFAAAVNRAEADLDAVARGMNRNAALAADTAVLLGRAGGDSRYVDMTASVAAELGATATAVTATRIAASEAHAAAQDAAETHRRKYGALDEIRRNRHTKTPKPGFFDD